MTTLGRRLDALEQIAEECRRREYEQAVRDEIVRRYAADGVCLPADQIEAEVPRVLALAERMARLAASGLTLEQIAQRMAVEHELDPDHVVEIFNEVRAR